VTGARDEEFQQYVRRRRGPLLRTATLLTSGDTHLAEDLVQVALTRLYLAWPRARGLDTDAYARRIVVNALVDEKRRPFSRRERLRDQPPDQTVTDRHHRIDADPALLDALAALPPGMRAAVVLRHVEGYSVEETADALGCSVGTVKSQTARGLDKLRDRLVDRVDHR
jgi:RNA polymerase sigma-70 factor (sigma-E family)